MTSDEEIIRKYKNGEDITVEEYERYMRLGIPEEESEPLGMYGKILDKLIEEHCWIKSVVMGADYYDFLLSIDKRANELYDVMDEKLSKDERFKMTGNYLEDVRRLQAKKDLIHEEIMNEVIYPNIDLKED